MESLKMLRAGRSFQTLDRVISAIAVQAFPYDERQMCEFRTNLFTSFIMQFENDEDDVHLTDFVPTDLAIALLRMSILEKRDLRDYEQAGTAIGVAIGFMKKTSQAAAKMIDDIEMKVELVRKTS